MALHIVTAEERLSEANAKTTVAIFGPPGVGKTSLLCSGPCSGARRCASTSRPA
jgi:ATP-dependent Lon protease